MASRGGRKTAPNSAGDAQYAYGSSGDSFEITIYPTNADMAVVRNFGIGNSLFTFDPNNPPAEIKKIISARAGDDLMRTVGFDFSSRAFYRGLSTMTTKSETITGSDGTERSFEYDEAEGHEQRVDNDNVLVKESGFDISFIDNGEVVDVVSKAG
ncbi:MAG: hypothetical protein U9N42_08950, partial [Campylobacterota bacterium]|nr:hypothetical protein [Campylobacterota bacterium]